MVPRLSSANVVSSVIALTSVAPYPTFVGVYSRAATNQNVTPSTIPDPFESSSWRVERTSRSPFASGRCASGAAGRALVWPLPVRTAPLRRRDDADLVTGPFSPVTDAERDDPVVGAPHRDAREVLVRGRDGRGGRPRSRAPP